MNSSDEDRHRLNTTRDASKAFVERELRALEKAYRDGHPGAAAAAIQLCVSRPLPAWLSTVVLEALRVRTVKRGRLANPQTEMRQNRIHYTRWDAVRELQDRKDDLSDIASNQEERYAAVSELLKGTEAAGSEETIKKSYLLVENAFSDGHGGKFHLIR